MRRLLVAVVIASFLTLRIDASTLREKLVHEIPTCARATDGANVTCIQRCIGGREGARGPVNPFLVFDRYDCGRSDNISGGFPAHPHRGFMEIRYFHAGGLRHEDSCGGVGETRAGGAQVLLANRGIVHEELPLADGSATFRGFQIWVNVPAIRKAQPPAYFNVNDIAQHAIGGSSVRVLAGNFRGVTGPLSHLHDSLLFVDITRLSTTATVIESSAEQHALVYVYKGAAIIGRALHDQELLQTGELAVLTQGDHVVLAAAPAGTAAGGGGETGLLYLTAAKVNEPVFLSHGFAANSKAALDCAIADLMDGKSSHC